MVKLTALLIAFCLGISLAQAGQVLKRAEEFTIHGLTYGFSVSRFNGRFYSSLKLFNNHSYPIKEYYRYAYGVALGVDGNTKMTGKNHLRMFGWGPLRRVQHDLGPDSRTGAGVPICIKGANGTVCSNTDFVVSSKRVHSFEFYIIKNNKLELIRQIHLKFPNDDAG